MNISRTLCPYNERSNLSPGTNSVTTHYKVSILCRNARNVSHHDKSQVEAFGV